MMRLPPVPAIRQSPSPSMLQRTLRPSVTNNATVSGGGELNTTNDSASDPTTVTPVADLTITKTAQRQLRAGTDRRELLDHRHQCGRWTNERSSHRHRHAASRSDRNRDQRHWLDLHARHFELHSQRCARGERQLSRRSRSQSMWPRMRPRQMTNTAAVSGGGELNTANDSASDPTTIGNGPDLIVTKTHSGNFTQGQTGAQYTITVKNTGGSQRARRSL